MGHTYSTEEYSLAPGQQSLSKRLHHALKQLEAIRSIILGTGGEVPANPPSAACKAAQGKGSNHGRDSAKIRSEQVSGSVRVSGNYVDRDRSANGKAFHARLRMRPFGQGAREADRDIPEKQQPSQPGSDVHSSAKGPGVVDVLLPTAQGIRELEKGNP